MQDNIIHIDCFHSALGFLSNTDSAESLLVVAFAQERDIR